MCFSNRDPECVRVLSPGTYGLSNSLINSPWQKVDKGKKMFSDIISSPSQTLTDDLLGLLSDDTWYSGPALPYGGWYSGPVLPYGGWYSGPVLPYGGWYSGPALPYGGWYSGPALPYGGWYSGPVLPYGDYCYNYISFYSAMIRILLYLILVLLTLSGETRLLYLSTPVTAGMAHTVQGEQVNS